MSATEFYEEDQEYHPPQDSAEEYIPTNTIRRRKIYDVYFQLGVITLYDNSNQDMEAKVD